MKLNQPIGNAIWAPLLVRLPLGTYFLLAGWAKLSNMPGFAKAVRDFHLMPDHVATLYASLLPYVELCAGTFLIIGIWTTLAAVIVSLMLFTFILAFGVIQAEGNLFNKDILLLGASLSLLYSGAGAYSIDNFRKTG